MRKIPLRKPSKSTIMTITGIIVVVVFLSLTLGRTINSDKQPDLGSFTTVHFAGYLFFLLIPVEALIPYYMAVGHNLVILWVIAVISALVALTVDYGIGYATPENIVIDLVGKKKYCKYKKIIDKYGDLTVLFFNLFPLSSPIVVLLAGIVRFKLSRVLFFSFVGLAIKYWFLVTIFSGI